MQDWSEVPRYKGKKVLPVTPSKATSQTEPAEKVFTLVPKESIEKVGVDGIKIARPRGRPPKL